MNHPTPASPPDLWSDWVLGRRDAGDAAHARQVQAEIGRIVERVLDGAGLAPGVTLLDLGSGEGRLPWRAIERCGPTLQVIVSDISSPLLEHARQQAAARGVAAQCRFLLSGAESLAEIADASVDVVTTRAVLAYVADKRAALNECLRVLRPGGRLSIAEPILREEALRTAALRQLLQAREPSPPDRFLELMHRWKSAQFPDTEAAIAASPIANYGERDLLRWAQECGFAEIHLELHIDVRTSRVPTWQVFLDGSPHPWAPSLGALMAERFSIEERQVLEQGLRPIIESGRSLTTDYIAYLQATKPVG